VNQEVGVEVAVGEDEEGEKVRLILIFSAVIY
jgi:hypothetical protein